MIYEYLLTVQKFKALEKKLGEKRDKLGNIIQENRFFCRKCGKAFNYGDIVVSKPKRNGRRVLYHKPCYEGLWLDTDESLVKMQIIDKSAKITAKK